MIKLLQLILIILPTVPFIALTILGYPSIGALILIVVFAINLVGLLTNNPHYGSLFSLITALIISLASQGYVLYITHTALIPLQSPGIFNISVLAPEYSLVLSYLYRSYRRYIDELKSRGFDKVEVDRELNALIRHVLAILTIALLTAVMLYYLMIEMSMPVIDPFTALVVFAVIYAVISRYIITRVKS